MNYLMFRLFAAPTFAIISSVPLYYVLAYWLPAKFAATPLFSPFGEAVRAYASPMLFMLFGVGLAWFLYNLYRFWQWYEGEGPCCPQCGSMMEDKTGRRGAYMGCMRSACRGTLSYWR